MNAARAASPAMDSSQLKSRMSLHESSLTSSAISPIAPASSAQDYAISIHDELDQEKRASVSHVLPSSRSGPDGYIPLATNSTAPGSLTRPLDLLLNHPALPVMCYCAASILMTVVNKVRCFFLRRQAPARTLHRAIYVALWSACPLTIASLITG